jgi:hypothetical protein
MKGLRVGQLYCRSLVSGQRAIYALFNHGEFWELAMVQRAIASAIVVLLIVAHLCLGSGSVYAQQQIEDFSQKYEKEVSKARTECSILWSNHDFDSLRAKIPLGDEKPTFSMLKSVEKLNRQDRPLADLANVGRPTNRSTQCCLLKSERCLRVSSVVKTRRLRSCTTVRSRSETSTLP